MISNKVTVDNDGVIFNFYPGKSLIFKVHSRSRTSITLFEGGVHHKTLYFKQDSLEVFMFNLHMANTINPYIWFGLGVSLNNVIRDTDTPEERRIQSITELRFIDFNHHLSLDNEEMTIIIATLEEYITSGKFKEIEL